ncbi:MAG TPA: hypothetical protein VFH61_12290 [Thermoleophilia bacterium]|nr:hypothetical protein [Thermoleophilia bacterium]
MSTAKWLPGADNSAYRRGRRWRTFAAGISPELVALVMSRATAELVASLAADAPEPNLEVVLHVTVTAYRDSTSKQQRRSD